MHSAIHTTLPRSAATKSMSGLSAGPAVPPPPPPPRVGAGVLCSAPLPRPPPAGGVDGGVPCGACAASVATHRIPAHNTALTRLFMVPLFDVPIDAGRHSRAAVT